MSPKLLALTLLAAGSVQAEFLRIEVFIQDMNCASCADTLVASLKRMKGIEQVEADLKTGNLRLGLAAQNRVGIEQVWDAVKRVGFTPGASKVTVRGTVKDGKLDVPETGKTYAIDGKANAGDSAELKGTMKPPPDPRTMVRIQVE